MVEIKARFDETNNIEWADRLAESGIHVVYGHVGLKTRQINAGAARGSRTANLRSHRHRQLPPSTSKLYTDLSLLTTDPDIGDDATDIFNY